MAADRCAGSRKTFSDINKKPGPAAAGPGFLEFFLIVLAEGIAAAIAAPSAAAEEQ